MKDKVTTFQALITEVQAWKRSDETTFSIIFDTDKINGDAKAIKFCEYNNLHHEQKDRVLIISGKRYRKKVYGFKADGNYGVVKMSDWVYI